MSVSSEAKENLPTKDVLTCFLCQKIFVEPMLLSCGHTFCLKCVEKCLRKCTNCPLCRTTTLQPTHNVAMNEALMEYKEAEKRNLNVFQRSIAQPLMRSFRGQRRGTTCKEAKCMQRETKMAAKGRRKDVPRYLKEKTLTTDTVDRTECTSRPSPIPLPPSAMAVDRKDHKSKTSIISLPPLGKCVLETSFYDDADGITTSFREIGLNTVVEHSNTENRSPTADSGASHTDDGYFSKTSRNVDERTSRNEHSDENDGQNSGRSSKSNDKSVEICSDKSSPTSLGGRSSDERRSFCRLRQKISYKVNAAVHIPTPPPRGVTPADRRILGDITQAGGRPRAPLAPIFARPRTIKATKSVQDHLADEIANLENDRTCHPVEDHLTHAIEDNLMESAVNSKSAVTVNMTKDGQPMHTKRQNNLCNPTDDCPTTTDLFPLKMPETDYDNKVHRLTLSKKREDSSIAESTEFQLNKIRKSDSRASCNDNTHALSGMKKTREINTNDVSIVVVSLVDSSQLLYHVISQAFAINFGCVELMDADDVIRSADPTRFEALQAADLTVFVYSAQDSMSIDNLRQFLRHSCTTFFQKNILFTVLNVNDGSGNGENDTVEEINKSLMKIISPHFVYEINAINMPYELPVVIKNILLRDKYLRDGQETTSYRSEMVTNFVAVDDKCRQQSRQKCAIM